MRKVEKVLIESGQFSLPGRKALYDTETVIEVIVVDVTEQPIERPKTPLKKLKFSRKVAKNAKKKEIAVQNNSTKSIRNSLKFFATLRRLCPAGIA